MVVSGILSLSYICLGTILLWLGITFINGTLYASHLNGVYQAVTSPLWRMVIVLPLMGLGHLFFSMAMAENPAVAGPGGIVFTVVPPAIYALWLLRAVPNEKIVFYALGLIVLAVLLGVELDKLSKG